MKEYQHLFFDLDHTLWDFETNSNHAINELFLKHLQHLDCSADTFINKYQELNRYYWGLYRDGKIKKDKLRTIRFESTLNSFGIKDLKLAQVIGTEYLKISPYKTALIPNTIEVLDFLKNKNYQMHIITNGFKEVQHIKLKESGLVQYFDEVVITENIGVNKPNPKVFNEALKLTKASNNESIMIGDDLMADVIGARNVGIDQVFYNPQMIPIEEDVTHNISNLIELKNIL